MRVQRGLVTILLLDNIRLGTCTRLEQRVQQASRLFLVHDIPKLIKERFKFLLMSRLYENGFQPPNSCVCSFKSFYHSGCLRLIYFPFFYHFHPICKSKSLNLEFIALGNALLLNVHFN